MRIRRAVSGVLVVATGASAGLLATMAGVRAGPGRVASGVAGGINVEPSMRPWRYSRGANPDGWWCTPPHCLGGADPSAMAASELSLAHELDVADVRVEFPWPLIEPSRGLYDWSRADAIVGAASEHGVTLQPVLVFSPAWAAPDATVAAAASDFEAFVRTLTTRYRGRFPVVELWNEPDGGHYWNSGEAAYVEDVLVPGYRGAHAGDPGVRVEMGAPDGDQPEAPSWLAGLYALGGGNAFDIAAFHNYGGTAAEEAAAYRAVLDSHGDTTRPIWLGEYGAQEESPVDAGQVALMSRVLGSGSALAMAQWYNLRDDDSVSCCPEKVEAVGHWGLVEHDGHTRKPGFAVMRQLLASAAVTAPTQPPAGTAAPAGPDATSGSRLIEVGAGALIVVLVAGGGLALRRRRRRR